MQIFTYFRQKFNILDSSAEAIEISFSHISDVKYAHISEVEGQHPQLNPTVNLADNGDFRIC